MAILSHGFCAMVRCMVCHDTGALSSIVAHVHWRGGRYMNWTAATTIYIPVHVPSIEGKRVHCIKMLMVPCSGSVWHKDQKAVCHCLAASLNLADDSNQEASS